MAREIQAHPLARKDPFLRIVAGATFAFSLAFGAAQPARADYVSDRCQGCHGPLATLPNGVGSSGAIRAANNPAYLKQKILPGHRGLDIVNFTDGEISAIATQIGGAATVAAPSITSGTPGGGTRGASYSHTVTATGAPTPAGHLGMGITVLPFSSVAAFRVTAGSLPTGLSISGSTGAITGTPSAAGTFTGTITVSNLVGTDATPDFSIVIAKSDTTTSLSRTGGVTPTTYGSSLTFTATVSGPLSTPNGAVQFRINGVNFGSPVVLSGGSASLVTTTFPASASDQTVTAFYSGDTQFKTSTSAGVSQTVNKNNTTTTLVRSAGTSPSTFGSSVGFQATVSGTSGPPTGDVNFFDGATNIGTVALAGGVATLTTSTISVAGSPHSITAVYVGDTTFNASTSSAVSQAVNPQSTTTTVTLNAGTNPSTFNTSITLQAAVTASGTPMGTVQFRDGGVNIGSPVVVAGGIALLPISTLMGGSHTITAVYSGDSNFAGSTSDNFIQTVNPATSITSVGTSGTPSDYGATVTFTATVTSAGATPTGTVQFKDGGVNIGGTVALSAGGVAALPVSSLTAGAHTITAVFSGNANFNTSTSVGLEQSVTPATPTIGTISSTVNPSLPAQSITLSVTVTSGVGTPTGQVEFKDGGVVIGAAVLIGTTASVTTAAITTAGPHTITAVYSGDSNFNTVTSANFTQTIAATSTTTVTNAVNPSNYLQSVTFAATVAGAGPTPTGTVQFKDGSVNLGGPQPLVVGSAGVTTSALTGGTHTITAVFSGDANYVGSTSTNFTQTVNRLAQAINFTSTPPAGAKAGDPAYTVTATGGASTSLVVFSVDATSTPDACSVAGASVSLLAVGTCEIAADQAADTNYNAAPTLKQSFAIAAGQFALTVTKSGGGTGLVTSTPSGIDCGATCSANFNSGVSVALGAAPSTGSFFKGWSGACTGTGACNVTMDAAKSVGAEFKLNTTIPRLANISTRMQVLTGNDVMIGGFIIGGSVPKTVVVRARGPSLIPFGIPNALANPRMDLYAGQTIIATNDDWQVQAIPADVAAITASGFAPTNNLESAIRTTLSPGAYTAVVSGVGNGTGVGIVEVFEVDLPEIPLINISTRGQVLLVNDVMIGGFIIQGDSPQTVVIRARGPSLIPFGIPNALLDPVLQLFDGQTPIATNDDWQVQTVPSDVAAIQSSGFAPSDNREAVIRITLPPGAYTAIVTGKNGTTGVGIVEVFAQ